MLAELETAEEVYRNSIPDITHHHIRLLLQPETVVDHTEKCDHRLEVSEILSTHQRRQKLQNSPLSTLLFALLGVIPFIGRFFRRIWGQPFWRTHYRKILTSP
jgi:hypothetical protein